MDPKAIYKSLKNKTVMLETQSIYCRKPKRTQFAPKENISTACNPMS